MYRPLESDLTLIKESMAPTDIWAFNQVPSVLFQSLARTQEQQRTSSFTSKYKVCAFKASPWRGRGERTRFYKEQISSCGWLFSSSSEIHAHFIPKFQIGKRSVQLLGGPEQIHWLPWKTWGLCSLLPSAPAPACTAPTSSLHSLALVGHPTGPVQPSNPAENCPHFPPS